MADINISLPGRTDGTRGPDSSRPVSREDNLPRLPGAGSTAKPTLAQDEQVDQQRTAEVHDAMPFARALGIEILSAAREEVRGRIRWSAELCTVANGLHGGLLMSLADTCGALVAFYNLPEGSTTSTIESKTNFLRGVSSGSVIATSMPLHIGRTTIVVVTDIVTSDGKLAARVTQTQAVLPALR